MESKKGMDIPDILTKELCHAMCVSKLAYRVAREIGMSDEQCYELAIAGMVHDVGRLEVAKYIYGKKDTLAIEELKYVRTHSTIGYTILNDRGYSDFILKSILYHHENYDGSGYPSNLCGEEIPIGARVLRVCDVFGALISDRLYRQSFDVDTAIELMIEDAKNFDMKIFLAFLTVIHEDGIIQEILELDGAIQLSEEEFMSMMKKIPVTGMKDISPREMEIRDYVIRLIKDTYKQFGYSSIETPCVEHIENLSSKQGGENEKLIFKILKRGDKLRLDEAKTEGDLVDSGLRYDLTVPLSRYYANNANDLPAPFKALQIGNVWRADRPQRGRFRQFMQCDIDILGEPTILAEIDLILATSTLVGKLDFKNFTIRINDRKILKAMAAYSGFKEECYDLVFIILDKMDKIGREGVAGELEKEGFSKESIDKYLDLFEQVTEDIEGIRYLKNTLTGFLDEKTADDLETVIESVDAVKTADFKLVFDPTLVRGMSYYTGTIFEISIDGFGGSVGGGGRYDDMIGKFTGQSTSAIGFSIGFERIVMLLLEKDYQVPSKSAGKVYLIEKNMSAKKLLPILKQAEQERSQGIRVNISIMKKNKKFQKEQLQNEGYQEFEEFFN